MNTSLCRRFNRLVGFDFLIEQFTVSVVAIHSDEDMTAGVRYSAAAGCATESAKYLRVDDAKPGTSQHRDRQCRHHRQMERHPIAGLDAAKISEKRSELIHSYIKLLISYGLGRLIL